MTSLPSLLSASALCSLTTLLALAACPPARAASQPPSAQKYFIYFGTYTGAKSKGIYRAQLEVPSGRVTTPELAAELPSPSFLTLHPGGRFLYAVNEVSRFAGKAAGGVSGFRIDPVTGQLTPLNQQSSGGSGPCHLNVDATGRFVLVANYGGGSVAVLPIQADGNLAPASCFIQHEGSSVNPQRQQAPHAHGIYPDSANRFVLVPDLGLDQVLVYRLDGNTGALTPNAPPAARLKPGSGPRHLVLLPNGRFAYVINELNCTITVFRYDSTNGRLTEVETTSTLPIGEPAQSGYSTAEIEVHPSGRFLYGSNRGHDSIVSYRINSRTGGLDDRTNMPTQGKTPRSFGIDPTGRFLFAANQGSDSVVVFRIDPKTGHLSPTGQTLEVGAPVCVKFLAAANEESVPKRK